MFLKIATVDNPYDYSNLITAITDNLITVFQEIMRISMGSDFEIFIANLHLYYHDVKGMSKTIQGDLCNIEVLYYLKMMFFVLYRREFGSHK